MRVPSSPPSERVIGVLWALTAASLVAFVVTWLAEAYAAEDALRPAQWTVGQAVALVAVVLAGGTTIVAHRLRAQSASPAPAAPRFLVAPSGFGLALLATGVLTSVLFAPLLLVAVAGVAVIALRRRAFRLATA